MEKTGPVSYKVNVPQETAVDIPGSPPLLPPQSDSVTTLNPSTPQNEDTDQVSESTTPPETPQSTEMTHTEHPQVTETVRRYPARITKPPVRYRDQ